MKKRPAKITAIILLLCIISSCSWAPSDDEAVNLVKNYYLFYYQGKEVDAKILFRGKYIRECKCYPIAFQVTLQGRESFNKTFYFYKNEYGVVETDEFQPKAKSYF